MRSRKFKVGDGERNYLQGGKIMREEGPITLDVFILHLFFTFDAFQRLHISYWGQKAVISSLAVINNFLRGVHGEIGAAKCCFLIKRFLEA